MRNAPHIGLRGWCALAASIGTFGNVFPAAAQDFWTHGEDDLDRLAQAEGDFALGTAAVSGAAASAAAAIAPLPIVSSVAVESPVLNYRGRTADGAAPIRYFEDFSADVGPEWNMGRISSMSPFGRFAGPYRASTHQLSVLVEPGEPLMVGFDLFIVGSAAGNAAASDMFRVLVDGEAVLESSIAELQRRHEELNGDKPNFDARMLTGLIALFVPEHPVAEIEFVVAESGDRGGESWGIDNVLVDHAPDEIEGLGVLEHRKYRDPIWGGSGTGGAAGGAPSYGGGGGVGGSGGGGGGGGGNFDPFTPVTGPEIDPPGADPDDPDDPDDTEPTPPEVPTPGTTLLLVMAGGTAMRRKRPGC